MRIALERPDARDVAELVAELDALQAALYPPESNHGIGVATLAEADALFAVARDEAGMAVGCGAIVLGGEAGELKRMFVRRASRARGIGRGLPAFLEAAAMARGCERVLIETGVGQPEALRLYASRGYARRGPFGGYADDPLSVFMEKSLDR